MTTGIPFGNYLLQRRIARGGMAEVFLAVQQGPEGFQRKVAVKRILPHLADIPQFQEMFLDEARLAAQLTHPNIAHIYEFGSFRDNFYIAMEHIDGVDLGAVVLQGLSSPLPLEHTARIVAEVCSALNYAHKLSDSDGSPLGLVHRDISPQNIMVSFDGAVKVLDFGIAKAAHHVERTQPGVVRGKFSYMSPEQVVGEKLDGRSDLFCAGIVLHELCAASPLFPRTDAVAAMQMIRQEKIEPPTREGERLPAGLEAVLMRALEKDPDHRFDNAADMQLALEQYLVSSGRLSNSVLLGRYFSEHYRSVREQADHRASSEPLREAEVFSTAGLEQASPQLPRVEILGRTADLLRRGGSHPDQASPAPTEELTGADLNPVSDLQLDTTAGTRPLRGPPPDAQPPTLHQATTEDTRADRGHAQSPARPRVTLALAMALGLTVVVSGVTAGYLISPTVSPDPRTASAPSAQQGGDTPATAPESEPLGEVSISEDPLPVPMEAAGGPDSQLVRLRSRDAAPDLPPPVRQPPPKSRSTRVVSTPASTSPTGSSGAGQRKGYLSVSTIPWTQVYLATGRLLGITPLARVSLPAGQHRLLLKNPSGISRVHQVTIRPGKVTRVRLKLGR